MKTSTLLTLIILVVGASAILLHNVSNRRGTDVPDVYRYSTAAYTLAEKDAPQRGRERPPIPLSLQEPRGLALGLHDAIAVVGDTALLLLDRNGNAQRRIPLEAPPTCVTWLDNRILVGFATHIATFSATGTRKQAWTPLGEQAYLTSLAATSNAVFAADYGQHLVWHFDPRGRLRGHIDGRGPAPDARGFIIPSPYFDVATHDTTLWIVNPGRQRVEGYHGNGTRYTQWGQAATTVEGFCGCCNPSHIAILSDGSFITSEKGIPRVKHYTSDGSFLGIIASSTTFPDNTTGLDLAVDSKDRVLVLEPTARRIRIFSEVIP